MERMGLIPDFRGLLIRDCLGAYFTLRIADTDFATPTSTAN